MGESFWLLGEERRGAQRSAAGARSCTNHAQNSEGKRRRVGVLDGGCQIGCVGGKCIFFFAEPGALYLSTAALFFLKCRVLRAAYILTNSTKRVWEVSRLRTPSHLSACISIVHKKRSCLRQDSVADRHEAWGISCGRNLRPRPLERKELCLVPTALFGSIPNDDDNDSPHAPRIVGESGCQQNPTTILNSGDDEWKIYQKAS